MKATKTWCVGCIYFDTDNYAEGFMLIHISEDTLTMKPLNKKTISKYGNNEDGTIDFIYNEDTVWYEKSKFKFNFMPNGLESWAETHHHIVAEITLKRHNNEPSKTLEAAQNNEGIAGIWVLGRNLTNAFEFLYQDIIWGEDIEWMDTIEKFTEKYLK